MNEMKKEAIVLMRMMGLSTIALEPFIKEDKVAKSEPDGIIFALDPEEQVMVDDFQNEEGHLVFHVLKTDTKLGVMYSLLYVSKHTEDYQMKRDMLIHGDFRAYVINVDNPECSEYGLIGLDNHFGGIIRTY